MEGIKNHCSGGKVLTELYIRIITFFLVCHFSLMKPNTCKMDIFIFLQVTIVLLEFSL